MIRFAMKPDRVFCELINCVITDTVDNYLNFDDPRDQEDWLCACMPRGARYFTAPEAKDHLLKLRQIHHDDRLYQISKYHWLLLYECLETFCQGFNEQPIGWLRTTYGIQRIDFGRLVRLFFGETTCLSDHLANMGLTDRHTMLIWPETVGLSAGFKTHPGELTVALCDDALTKDFDEQQAVVTWFAGSSFYPCR